MNDAIREELLINTKKWIYQAGDNIREQMEQAFKIDTKSNANDLVTDVDRATEQFFLWRT